MWETGKKVYYRDENFKAQIGTIQKVLELNSAVVILQVLGTDEKLHEVWKINPDESHRAQVEEDYKLYGHY